MGFVLTEFPGIYFTNAGTLASAIEGGSIDMEAMNVPGSTATSFSGAIGAPAYDVQGSSSYVIMESSFKAFGAVQDRASADTQKLIENVVAAVSAQKGSVGKFVYARATEVNPVEKLSDGAKMYHKNLLD